MNRCCLQHRSLEGLLPSWDLTLTSPPVHQRVKMAHVPELLPKCASDTHQWSISFLGPPVLRGRYFKCSRWFEEVSGSLQHLVLQFRTQSQ